MKSNCRPSWAATAAVTVPLAVILQITPAIADSNLENSFSTIENQKYNNRDATPELTSTHVSSAYMKLFDTVNQAIATIGVEFEDPEHQRILLDLFSGEILRSVYASSSDLSDIAGTAANEIAQFMNLALQKHSGGDPHLAANKRADYKFGFDPNNFCITHTPASVGGNASN